MPQLAKKTASQSGLKYDEKIFVCLLLEIHRQFGRYCEQFILKNSTAFLSKGSGNLCNDEFSSSK